MKSKFLLSYFGKCKSYTFNKAFCFAKKNKTDDIVHKAVRSHEEASYNRLPTGNFNKKNNR